MTTTSHDISTETYAQLVRLVNRTPECFRWGTGAESVAIGQPVAVYSRGMYRAGVVIAVTKNGTGRATVAYVTAGGLADAARYGYTNGAPVTTKTDAVSDLRIPGTLAEAAPEATPVPAPAPEPVQAEEPTTAPELDDLVRAFYAAEKLAEGETDGPAFDRAKAAYRAMMAAAPRYGWSSYGHAKKLGLIQRPTVGRQRGRTRRTG